MIPLTSSSGRVGCAYYDPAVRILYVLEDTQESLHFDLTRMRKHILDIREWPDADSYTVLEQVDPDIVLTSSRADDDFKDMLVAHSTYEIYSCTHICVKLI